VPPIVLAAAREPHDVVSLGARRGEQRAPGRKLLRPVPHHVELSPLVDRSTDRARWARLSTGARRGITRDPLGDGCRLLIADRPCTRAAVRSGCRPPATSQTGAIETHPGVLFAARGAALRPWMRCEEFDLAAARAGAGPSPHLLARPRELLIARLLAHGAPRSRSDDGTPAGTPRHRVRLRVSIDVTADCRRHASRSRAMR
jgi:hypothetical protein